MVPLNFILSKCLYEYKLYIKKKHQMCMDDIKLFAKNGKELETLIQTVRIYSEDVGMDFGIEKCAMLIMKSRKRQMTKGIELLNQENIARKNGIYKYLGVLEADTIKHAEMREKI